MSQIKLSRKFEPLFEWLGCDEQNPLHKVDTVVITGGRYSQKSFGVGLFSCIAGKDWNHRILYTRYTLTSAEDSIIPEFKEKLDILNCQADFNVQKDRIEGIKNQSKIVFKGVKTSSGNQTANLKSLKNFSIFILEEAEEMTSFDNWDKIKKSIRSLDVRNLSILILNPTTKEHWVYTELFEAKGVNEGFNGIKGNVLYIHSSYLDIEREFIADNIFEDFEEKRLAYEEYEALSKEEKLTANHSLVKGWTYYKYVVKGGWLNTADGVIFTNWEIGEFQEVAPSVYGQDYGFSVDPTTLIQTSIDKSRKVIYIKELLHRTKLTTSQIVEFNKLYAGKSLIYADSAEPRLIEELKKAGCNIKEAVKGQGSVSAGIAMLQDYRLVIDPNSVNLLKELNNYVWHDKKSNTPIDLWNHCFVGETLIETNEGLKRIDKIQPNDKVLTRMGYRSVNKIFYNGYREVRNYIIKCGIFEVSVTCTPDHKILTDTGWKQIQNVSQLDKIFLSKNLMEKSGIYTKMKDITQKGEIDFIGQYGNIIMDQYRKGFMFITLMRIQQITQSKICVLKKDLNTLVSMLKKGLKKIQNHSKKGVIMQEDSQIYGMDQKKVGNGTKNTPDKLPIICNQKNLVASNAELNSGKNHVVLLNSVLKNVNLHSGERQELILSQKNVLSVDVITREIDTQNQKHVVKFAVESIESKRIGSKKVYDFEVDQNHEYIANGILVHNCLDAVRYACYSQHAGINRKWVAI